MSVDPEQTASLPKWWIANEGKADGPYGRGYIQAALIGGQFPGTTLGCLVGTDKWRPISEWSEFTTIAGPPPLPSSFRRESPPVGEQPLTNRHLPRMANWICIYCLAVSPALWALNNLSCGITHATGAPNDPGTAFFELVGVVISTWITVKLFLGGRRLRALRASGCKFVKGGICLHLGYFAICLMLLVLAIAWTSSDATDSNQSTASSSTPLSNFAGLCSLVAIGFEIVALVWLQRRGKWLPYDTE